MPEIAPLDPWLVIGAAAAGALAVQFTRTKALTPTATARNRVLAKGAGIGAVTGLAVNILQGVV